MKRRSELDPTNPPDKAQGKAEGKLHRDAMTATVREFRQLETAEFQARFLRRIINSPDGVAAADDVPNDLRKKYRRGAYVGAAIVGLLNAKIIKAVGRRASARPSRHGCEVKVFAIADRRRAELKLAALDAFIRGESQKTKTAAPGATGATNTEGRTPR